jgi:uncharacterized membrane protein YccC
MVLIIFNLIAPTGWSVGLIRIQDVIIGAMVGIVVSVLLWPRGVRKRVSKVIDESFAVGARFLTAAVLRVTRGASEEATDRVIALSQDALEASRTVDDGVRQYLSESSGAADVRAPVVRRANRAVRLRAAAELIADVVPPPHGVYARVRKVLEAHTDAVCHHVTGGSPGAALQPISDDFVVALRAEATDDELAVAAALPLVTAAAHIGELELLYPRSDPGPPDDVSVRRGAA